MHIKYQIYTVYYSITYRYYVDHSPTLLSKIHRKNKLFNDVKTSFFSVQICTYYTHFAFDNELVVFLGKVRIQTNGAIGTPLSVGD